MLPGPRGSVWQPRSCLAESAPEAVYGACAASSPLYKQVSAALGPWAAFSGLEGGKELQWGRILVRNTGLLPCPRLWAHCSLVGARGTGLTPVSHSKPQLLTPVLTSDPPSLHPVPWGDGCGLALCSR